jgi:hypothetical protein
MNKLKVLLQFISLIPWLLFVDVSNETVFYTVFSIQMVSFLSWIYLDTKKNKAL